MCVCVSASLLCMPVYLFSVCVKERGWCCGVAALFDALGCRVQVELPKDEFVVPKGWRWDGDWYISPELRLVLRQC